MIHRALAVWLLIASAEIVHGIFRAALLEPQVGDFRARQIAVFTGSAILFAIVYATIPWIRPRTARRAIGIGFLWLGLMLTFEIAIGRFVGGYTWDRIASDYDLSRGGLLPIGMAVLAAAPFLAGRIRRLI